MAAYLKIENPGVADPTAFTLLGASTSRNSSNSNTIGKFGSGNKHGVAVCLRSELPPIVFAGNLRMTFGTTPVKVETGLQSSEFSRVQVKYGGKDRDGRNRSGTEDLGFVLEYGATDWLSMDLALREFVSNAIDRAIAEDQQAFALNYVQTTNLDGLTQSEIQDKALEAYREYEKTSRPWDKVTVEVVNENQVRAKEGMTRVFIPMNTDVFNFYENLGKWFLHFSEPELLKTTILPKGNRNLTDRKAAVIYRRGVRVREFESSDIPSLFDYNLDHLELDEARKVDDWRVKHGAAQAVMDASPEQLGILFNSFAGETKYWEWGFDQGSLESRSWHSEHEVTQRKENWNKAFTSLFGEATILAASGTGEVAQRKGYRVIQAPEAIVNASKCYGVKTPETVLTKDDREGRTILDATPDALAATKFVWDVVVKHGMDNGKPYPAVKCFHQIMSAGAVVLGFYRDNTVYLNTDIAGKSGDIKALSQNLLVTALEEVCHHVTGAMDNSRDFQDWCLNLAVKLAMEQASL